MAFKEWFFLFMERYHVVVMVVTLSATFVRYPINLWLAQKQTVPPYSEDDLDQLKQMILLFVWWKRPWKEYRMMKVFANLLFLLGPASSMLLILLGMIAQIG